MPTYNIELNDSDVLSIDDSTGNITLKSDNLPENVAEKDIVFIHYAEDSASVQHKYVVDSFDADTKSVNLSWQEMIEDKQLNESPTLKLSDADYFNPDKIDFKQKIKDAEEEEAAAEQKRKNQEEQQKLKEKNSSAVSQLTSDLSSHVDTQTALENLFELIVPNQGPAETVAGELLRAMMRLLYRDYNDGDKFFEGYGLETCASSAEYLFDNGFDKQIQSMLDDAYRLSSDDDDYTASLNSLAKDVLEYLAKNDHLFWTKNLEDSRDYTDTYITENQPTYDYELYASDDVVRLLDNGVVSSWDLKSYVEDAIEYEQELKTAEVDRPWSSTSSTVTLSNLTRDGLDRISDLFESDPDRFWQDFVSQYEEDEDEDQDEFSADDQP